MKSTKDLNTLMANIWKNIAQTKLPNIPRWGNEAYAGKYDKPVPFYRMMVVDNPNSLLWSTAYVMGAPITMTSDAIATARTTPKILYNFWADLLNAEIDKHNYNNYMKNLDEDTKKKIQRRWIWQIWRDPNAQTNLTWKAFPTWRIYRYKKTENNIPRITL
jgi:hypothetical protein